jgi:predicted cobalt transporter CbtA
MNDRTRRKAAVCWLLGAVVVWNGIFDFVQTRGIKEYLLRTALHELGRGPDIPLPLAMSLVTRDAIWISTLWASAILLGGLLTIRVCGRHADR